MKFEGMPLNHEDAVDVDLPHRIDPIAPSWSEAARRESYSGSIPERTLDYTMKAWRVTEDDTLEGGQNIVLEDEEIRVLNTLLQDQSPLPTPKFQELLPDVSLRHATEALLNRGIITNAAGLSLRRAHSSLSPKRTYERDTGYRMNYGPSRQWRHSPTWSWAISPKVSIDDVRGESLPPKSLAEIKQEIETSGYAILDDEILGGFGLGFRKQLLENYFNNPDVVKLHEHDMPPDRKRARVVVTTALLQEAGVMLSPEDATFLATPTLYVGNHDSNAVEHRSDPDIIRPGEYSRLEIFQSPSSLRFIHMLNELIPERHRPAMTTFGINAFRTRTDVVSRPHQDGVNYVFVYVVDVKGVVPRTKLYLTDGDGHASRPKVSHCLQPGQLIAFKDSRFYHYTSKLTPGLDGEAQRDVMVFTADNPTTVF